MTDDIMRRRTWRTELLRRLYFRAGGGVAAFFPGFELGEELGMDRAEARKVLEYLEEKGWVRVDDYRGGMVRLTAEGVDRVEAGEEAE